MTASQMRMAAKILSGDVTDDSADVAVEDFERLYVSDSEDESFTEIEMNRQNRLQKARELIYNDSDDEDNRSAISTHKQTSSTERNAFDMIKNGTDPQDERTDDNELRNDNVNQAPQFDSEEFNSQVIRRRLAELDDSDNELNPEIGWYLGLLLKSNWGILICVLFLANDVDDRANDENEKADYGNKRERSIADDVTVTNDNDDDDDDGPINMPQKKRAKLSIIDDDSDDD